MKRIYRRKILIEIARREQSNPRKTKAKGGSMLKWKTKVIEGRASRALETYEISFMNLWAAPWMKQCSWLDTHGK